MKSLNKELGDLAELEYVLNMTRLGFVVSKPYGDNSHYDFIVEANKKLLKVQVKSCSFAENKNGTNVYSAMVGCGSGSKSAYSKDDVDVFAIKVHPENAWYYIPIDSIDKAVKINLRPHVISNGKYEKYKSNLEVFK